MVTTWNRDRLRREVVSAKYSNHWEIRLCIGLTGLSDTGGYPFIASKETYCLNLFTTFTDPIRPAGRLLTLNRKEDYTDHWKC
jgi:hypothetical protein